MGSDERGKTIHGYLFNEDYALLKDAVETYSTTINKFVSMATREVLRNPEFIDVVGEAARLSFERRLNGVQMRQAITDLKAENDRLKTELAAMQRTVRYR